MLIQVVDLPTRRSYDQASRITWYWTTQLNIKVVSITQLIRRRSLSIQSKPHRCSGGVALPTRWCRSLPASLGAIREQGDDERQQGAAQQPEQHSQTAPKEHAGDHDTELDESLVFPRWDQRQDVIRDHADRQRQSAEETEDEPDDFAHDFLLMSEWCIYYIKSLSFCQLLKVLHWRFGTIVHCPEQDDGKL